jgi:hypothetical protein
MNDITLDPDARAVKVIIRRAVKQKLHDSPVRYAFEDDWPVELSYLETQEVLESVRNYRPLFYDIDVQDTKSMAIEEVMSEMSRVEESPTERHYVG